MAPRASLYLCGVLSLILSGAFGMGSADSHPPDKGTMEYATGIAGVEATVLGEPVTSETGTTVGLLLRLTDRPTTTVVLHLTSSDPSEGFAEPDTVTFDPGNWDTPTTVTIRGVDDSDIDYLQDYWIQIAIETHDPGYSSVTPPTILFTNEDDEYLNELLFVIECQGGDSSPVNVRIEASNEVLVDERLEAVPRAVYILPQTGEELHIRFLGGDLYFPLFRKKETWYLWWRGKETEL